MKKYNLIGVIDNKLEVIVKDLDLREIDRITSSNSFISSKYNQVYIKEKESDKELSLIINDSKWSNFLNSKGDKRIDNTLSKLIRELIINTDEPNKVIESIEDDLLKMMLVKYFEIDLNSESKEVIEQMILSEEQSKILHDIYRSLYRYEGLRSLYIGLKKYKVKEEKINTK